MTVLSERLKALRKKHKLTQKDIANYLGMTESGYGYYEQGRNEPSIETLQKLAVKYNVSISYLTGEEHEGKKALVADHEIELTEEEFNFIKELKKHPLLFHELASDPAKKVKELIKLFRVKQFILEEDIEEYGDVK